MDPQVTISSIIFIVLLIVPGVFFKRFYYRGQFTKQFGAGLFADRLITSIFWGIVVQIITFLVFSKTFNFSYDNIKEPISDIYAQLSAEKLPDFTIQNLIYALAYLFSSVITASILGAFSHWFIRYFKIDSKFELFRFANHWHYYFKGDILFTGELKNKKKGKVLSTLVDIVIENGEGKTKMLSGFLSQYHISHKTGELEAIYITDAKRFSTTKNEFKEIEGDGLIIPYQKVIDLNLKYNIKVVKEGRKKELLNMLMGIFIIFGTLFFLIYPWFLEIRILLRILGILLSLFSFLLFITFLIKVLRLAKEDNLSNRAAIYVLLISLLLFGLVSFIYGLI